MKHKTILIVVVLLLVLIVGLTISSPQGEEEYIPSNTDPENTTYLLEGDTFSLKDGYAEKEVAPNSATRHKVALLGIPAYGDLDRDGDEDAVVILASEPGGSGTFYYVTVAVQENGEFKGSESILLGDRITVQNVYVEDDRAKIEYLERNNDESFDVEPSVRRDLHLQVDKETGNLVQVAVDFEGEADPNVMTLDMHMWRWIKTTYNNDTEILPSTPGEFTLTLGGDGTFSATTDCNSMSGSYETTDNKISFGPIAMTRMFCEGSNENDFAKSLEESQSYFFTSKGEMVFDLKFDSGSVIFR